MSKKPKPKRKSINFFHKNKIDEEEGPSVQELIKVQENTNLMIFQQMSIFY